MGIETYLGNPPQHIVDWIKAHSTPSEPTAPNGKVLYKTSADGEWLQSDADIVDGAFNGFNEKDNAVAIIIPSKDANGNDVTSIGESALMGCSKFINITIPNSVKSIGLFAFSGCNSLTSMTIPNSVTSIGDSAFYFSSGLTSVTIPSSVTSIGENVFGDCSNLTSMTIPDSVTSIGQYAFSGCSGLTSVTITANGGNAANVKQMMIDAGVSSSITWNMPS